MLRTVEALLKQPQWGCLVPAQDAAFMLRMKKGKLMKQDI